MSEELAFWSSLGTQPASTSTVRPPPPGAVKAQAVEGSQQDPGVGHGATTARLPPQLGACGPESLTKASEELAFWTSLGGQTATAAASPPQPG